jgi:hypothetical protein
VFRPVRLLRQYGMVAWRHYNGPADDGKTSLEQPNRP